MQSALLGGEAPLKSAWQADAYDAKLWITDRPWLALYGNWLSPKPRREVWLAAGWQWRARPCLQPVGLPSRCPPHVSYMQAKLGRVQQVLSEDLMTKILSCLEASSLVTASLVCRQWNRLAQVRPWHLSISMTMSLVAVPLTKTGAERRANVLHSHASGYRGRTSRDPTVPFSSAPKCALALIMWHERMQPVFSDLLPS